VKHRGGKWSDKVGRVTPNGHLHFALFLALGLAVIVALAVPISRSAANSNPPALNPDVGATTQGLTNTIRAHAAAITATVGGVATDSDGAAGLTFSESATVRLAARLVPASLLELTGAAAAGAALTSSEFSPVLASPQSGYYSFAVHQDGLTSSYSSAGATVGQALADAGVSLDTADIVFPDPSTLMAPGLHVYVRHATNVTLTIAGDSIDLHTYSQSVGDLLREYDITLEQLDEVHPSVTDALRDDMQVTVTTLRTSVELTDTFIPYRTVYTYDSTIFEGEEALVQGGENGSLRREYTVTRLNGDQVIADVISATLTLPVEQVIAVGTYVPPTPAPPPVPVVVASEPGIDIVCTQTLTVWATWYNAANSGGSGITATGTAVYKGIIATDPTVIPLGTQIYVPGYGFGIAADTGGGIIGNMIDLGYGPNDIVDWRTGNVDICVVG
jgi:3D (Asp-Asp-Asp) domain-containing protein